MYTSGVLPKPGGFAVNVTVSGTSISPVSDIAVLSFAPVYGPSLCCGSATLPLSYNGTGFNPEITVEFGSPIYRNDQVVSLVNGSNFEAYINAFLDVYQFNPANLS